MTVRRRGVLVRLALALSSSAPGSVVRPGFMAGGAVRQVSGFDPECGEFGPTIERLMGVVVEQATRGRSRGGQEIFGGPKVAKSVMDAVGRASTARATAS